MTGRSVQSEPPSPSTSRPRQALLFLASVAIACHLIAITVAAIPAPARGPLSNQPRADADPVAAVMQTPLTRFSSTVDSAQRRFRRLTSPVRPWSAEYARMLHQNWAMFASVLSVQRFVRLDFYVRSETDDSVQVLPFLVLPSQSDESPRLTYDSVDKAVRVSLNGFLARMRREPPDARAAAASLEPTVRLFTNRFASERGVRPQDILRTELWLGAAVILPPGEMTPESVAGERRRRLAEYRQGTPQVPANPYPAPDTMRDEADINWQLVYVVH